MGRIPREMPRRGTEEEIEVMRERDMSPVTLIVRIPRCQAESLAKAEESPWTLDDWIAAQRVIQSEAAAALKGRSNA